MALVYDDFYKTQVNNLAGQKNQSLADLNKLYDSQRSNLNAQYDAALNKAGAAYEDQYRNNAVQKLINERAVAENMANLVRQPSSAARKNDRHEGNSSLAR